MTLTSSEMCVGGGTSYEVGGRMIPWKTLREVTVLVGYTAF